MRIFVAPGIVIDDTKDNKNRLSMLHGSMLRSMQEGSAHGVSPARLGGRWFARWRRVISETKDDVSDEVVRRFVDGEKRYIMERSAICIHCWFSRDEYPADLDMQPGVPGFVLPGWRPSPTLVRINEMRRKLREKMPPQPSQPVEEYRPPKKIIIAPGISVSDRKDVEQSVVNLQASMLREFQRCVDQRSNLRAATGFWINHWFEFLGHHGASSGFYTIADYVESEMRRVEDDRRVRLAPVVARAFSKWQNQG